MLSINTDQIIREEKIGCGAFSEVFRVELKRKISINGSLIDKFVVKKSRQGALKFDETIDKFTALKKQNVKSLTFVEKILINGEIVLLVEDLNDSIRKTFVSPNTKIIDIELHKQMELLSNSILKKETGNKSDKCHFNSVAELYRSENLLTEIIDFEKDIDTFLLEIKSISNMELFTDCFFFSSSLVDRKTKIDYVIADFDCINFNDYYSKFNIMRSNQSEFLRSYYEFVYKYSEDSERKKYYIEYLDKLIRVIFIFDSLCFTEI